MSTIFQGCVFQTWKTDPAQPRADPSSPGPTGYLFQRIVESVVQGSLNSIPGTGVPRPRPGHLRGDLVPATAAVTQPMVGTATSSANQHGLRRGRGGRSVGGLGWPQRPARVLYPLRGLQQGAGGLEAPIRESDRLWVGVESGLAIFAPGRIWRAAFRYKIPARIGAAEKEVRLSIKQKKKNKK